MDLNAIDVGQVLALLVFWYTTNKDKGEKAEDLGKMKQQIKSLETRAGKVDNQLNEINGKLNQLMESNARLETQLTVLINQN